MSLIILGLLILIAGFVARRHMSTFSPYAVYLRAIGFVIFLIGILSSCIVQIGPGEVGVQILFGSVQNNTLPSGLHFINPLIDVQRLDIKTENYTMSAVRDEGSKEGDDAIRVLTSDGLEVVMDLTVLYKVLPSSARIFYEARVLTIQIKLYVPLHER